MSSGPNSLEQKVRKVIRDYVMPKENILAMKRIHAEFMSEQAPFDSWDEAVEFYTSLEWNRERLSEFLSICKRVVEESEGKSAETYFRVINIDDPDDLIGTFDEREYSPDLAGESREGFRYDRSDDVIDGEYIYVDVNTQLTFGGEIQDLVTEGSITFTLDLQREILVLHSSSAVDVQRTKSIFNEYTTVSLLVYYHPGLDIQSNTQRFNTFIDGLEDRGLTVREAISVKLTKYSEDEVSALTELEYSGDFDSIESITANSEIREKIDQGWLIKSIKIKVHYQDELMSVTVASSNMMCYTKVEDYMKVGNGRAVQDIVRDVFLDVFNTDSEPQENHR